MNKLDILRTGCLVSIQGRYAGRAEYDDIQGIVSDISQDGKIVVATGSLGDVQLERNEIDPEKLKVVQYILDDFDRSFLAGRSILEVKLDRRLDRLSRRAGMSQKKMETLAGPAIKLAKSFKTIPHTSFRSIVSDSGKSPRPIDYSKNPL